MCAGSKEGAMSRPLRLQYAGALYHVTARGNRREAIFENDADRRGFLDLLAEVCKRLGWCCPAYCLMGNHYHLLAQTPRGDLADGMRHLNGLYTQRFNRRHGRVGHLLQGRYHAVLVDRDNYLLEVARYVVLNPVRAGIARHPGEWPWSSYRATIGRGAVPAWLQPDILLAALDADPASARRQYVRFVAAGLGEPAPWRHVRHELYLGDERFVAQHAQHIGGAVSPEIKCAHRAPLRKPLETYAAERTNARDAMACAYLDGHYRMREIAAHFAVHYSTVSRAVRSYERRMRDCKT
jgi:REP element-mobilizing transposase RayT